LSGEFQKMTSREELHLHSSCLAISFAETRADHVFQVGNIFFYGTGAAKAPTEISLKKTKQSKEYRGSQETKNVQK